MNANQPPSASFLASPLQRRRCSSVSNSTSNSSSISLLNQHQIQSESRNIFRTNNLTSSIEEDSLQSINSIITDNNSINNIINTNSNNKNNENIVNGYSYYPDINDLDKDMSHREQKNSLLRTPKSSTKQNINSNKIRRGSEFTDSSNLLLDSEWVLFSPSHSQYSNVTRGSDNNGYDDVLSSTIDRTATYTTSSQEYEEEDVKEDENDYDEDEEYEEDDQADQADEEEDDGDDDDDDSLIEALQNHMKSDNIINKDDLNSRIDNWRKSQVSLFLDDLTKSGVDNDTLELIKAWGIDDSEVTEADGKFYFTSSLSEAKNNLGTFINSSRGYFYGNDLIKRYTNQEIKVIKKVLSSLSNSLNRADDVIIDSTKSMNNQINNNINNESNNFKHKVRSHSESFINNNVPLSHLKRNKSFSGRELKNFNSLNTINRRRTLLKSQNKNSNSINNGLVQSQPTAQSKHQLEHQLHNVHHRHSVNFHTQHHHHHHHRHSQEDNFLNNKKLEKYIPLFLKDLIVRSNLIDEFKSLEESENDDDDNLTDVARSTHDLNRTLPNSPSLRPNYLSDNDTDSENFSDIDNQLTRASSNSNSKLAPNSKKSKKLKMAGSKNRRVSSSKQRLTSKTQISPPGNPPGNFWDNDLQSVNSSILTYSTGSIVGF
ncbi:hypothetical protein BVG19_g2354 [[Candida] boidinii]|nr:hypothetical protein BVG19_g2354 [[Candida] boidinii]OWB51402.1 hypothetical protein B5S27_g2962 [[Candida] boidinii]